MEKIGRPPFPADAEHVALFLAERSERMSAEHMDKVLSALRSESEERRIPWTLRNDFLLGRTRRGLRNLVPAGPHHERGSTKRAITLDLLGLALRPLRLEGAGARHDDVLFAAMSACAGNGAWRGCELCWKPRVKGGPGSQWAAQLLRKDLAWHARSTADAAVTVTLHDTKAARIAWSQLFADGTPTDPTVALERWLAFMPSKGANDLLFCRADGSPVSKAWFVQKAVEALKTAGLRSDGLRVSSFRAGCAQTMKLAGVTEDVIMNHGRWKGRAWMHYVCEAPGELRLAMRRAARWAVIKTAPIAP